MRTRRSVVVAVLCIATLALMAGCVPPMKRSLGVSANDVVAIEYFQYPWSQLPETLPRLTVRNREAIRSWAKAFRNVPVTDYSLSEEDSLKGQETQATRFLLRDGTSVEITKIWVGPHNSVVMWPDGTASRTEWGSPDLMSGYDGTVETVDAAEVPHAELPD